MATELEHERVQRDINLAYLAACKELERLRAEVERLEKRGMLLEQTLGDLLNHPIGCECIPCQVLHAEAG